MATDAVTVDPNDALKPSIPLARPSTGNPFTGEKLNQTKANWLEWSKLMANHLSLMQLGDYIKAKPSRERPPAHTHPNAYANWGVNDETVRAFISINCAKVEADLIESATSARECWTILETLHVAEGPVRQAQLLQDAFGIRITRGTEQVIQARKINDCITRTFDMPGGITKDSLINIALLRALGAGLEHTQAILQRDMDNATASAPFTAAMAIKYLERDLQLLSNSGSSTSVALAATSTSGVSSKAVDNCSNCKGRYHTAPYCVKEGGGMAGKTVAESKAQ